MNAASPVATDSRQDDFAAQVAAFAGIASESALSVSNLATSVHFVGSDGDGRVPATVNTSEPNNAWVCSPHTAYARYAIEELVRFGHPVLTKPLAAVCATMGQYLWRARIDDAVAVNNWLLSTNLYPPLDRSRVRSWIAEAVARWPGHAVWFRSLNARYNADWLKEVAACGCALIPSRQVYLYDRIEPEARHPQGLRRDFALLRRTSLRRVLEWHAEDYERAAQLYRLLYLDKYSRLNPDYTARFLRLWREAGLLDLVGYRGGDGCLQAVVGMFSTGSTITAPIVGYDTALPQRLGLYRLLMSTVYARAASTGQSVNLSAGAAEFKRHRGGVGAMEYSAVFSRHLSRNRRRALGLLGAMTRNIGEPIMRRYEL